MYPFTRALRGASRERTSRGAGRETCPFALAAMLGVAPVYDANRCATIAALMPPNPSDVLSRVVTTAGRATLGT